MKTLLSMTCCVNNIPILLIWQETKYPSKVRDYSKRSFLKLYFKSSRTISRSDQGIFFPSATAIEISDPLPVIITVSPCLAIVNAVLIASLRSKIISCFGNLENPFSSKLKADSRHRDLHLSELFHHNIRRQFFQTPAFSIYLFPHRQLPARK